MTVVMMRGVVAGAGVEGTLTMATVQLFAFAMVGLVVGSIAQSTVDTAVRQKLQQQLEAEFASE
jgi:hypothetical protein